MRQALSPSTLKTDLAVLGLLVALAAAAVLLRGALGSLVFVVLVAALLVQLIRFVFLRGRSETLNKLWDAVKEAFWGIG